MHKSTMLRMGWFVDNYVKQGMDVKVLDVGSYNVNGSYRELFDGLDVKYVGLDIEPGPNVDIVMDEPYSWSSIEDESFDYIISGQAFEHIEFPWLTIKEIYKKMKPGGVGCIIAPNTCPEHRYPYDCYRYFSDGMVALAKWAGFRVLDVSVAGVPELNVSPEWDEIHNDVCMVVMKVDEAYDIGEVPKLKYERRYDGESQQRRRYNFVTRWVEAEDKEEHINKLIGYKECKNVYIYGYGCIGKLIYDELKRMGVKVSIIDRNEIEVPDGVRFYKLGEAIDDAEDSVMIISVLDVHSAFKDYLDTIYDISKHFADEMFA